MFDDIVKVFQNLLKSKKGLVAAGLTLTAVSASDEATTEPPCPSDTLAAESAEKSFPAITFS